MNYFFLLLLSLLYLILFGLIAKPAYAVTPSTTNESVADSTITSNKEITSTKETTASETFTSAFIQGKETIYLSLIGIACILFLVLILFIHSKRH